MKAMIVVDIQNDFLPGGALAVPRGDEIIPVVNRLMSLFDLVVATQDWHPADHRSFASQHPGRRVGDVIDLAGLPQVLWPDHCVQGTHGAALASSLDASRIQQVFQKGVDRDIDSYSGFFDNGRRKATGLDAYLRQRSVREVFVVGLATDYCVKATAIDARGLGFETNVIVDAVRGVEIAEGDGERALDEMWEAGAALVAAAYVARSARIIRFPRQ